MGLFRREFADVVRRRVWFVGLLSGKRPRDIRVVVSELEREGALESAAAAFEAQTGATVPGFALVGGDEVGAPGDLLKKLLDWISSPEGMAFIKFIISLFLMI